jgi:hypothetical protein
MVGKNTVSYSRKSHLWLSRMLDALVTC